MTTWMLGRILWAAAILPPLVLLLDIYRRDRVEKEPPKLLAALFFGGAVSVLPAALLERAGFALAGRILPAGSVPHAALCCFAAVGLVEEGGKFLVLRLGSWRSPAFNYRFDGIVYAVFVSMGFALVENLLYVAGDGTLATALLRSVTAIPGHASFAVFMGFYYGTAKLYADAAGRCREPRRAAECLALARRNRLRAFWIPVLLHGFYDFCLDARLPWMGAVFFLFVLLLDAAAICQVRTAGRHDLPV